MLEPNWDPRHLSRCSREAKVFLAFQILVEWINSTPSLRISFRLQSLLYNSVSANVLTSINTPLSNFDSRYQMF